MAPTIRIRRTPKRPRGQGRSGRRDRAALSPGRTWRSGAVRGSAAGGWCARRCCHWSPSAPSRVTTHLVRPDPTQATRQREREKKSRTETRTRHGDKMKRSRNYYASNEACGGGDSPSSWRRRGLGSARVAWLADTAV